ncbi:MAG: cation-transporting P-type ATPase, partial [Chlamydiae bacterium]|nr:cation-transporting P-type ATPase [Chlamydiota bacterium]
MVLSDPVSTLYEYFASGSEDVANPFLRRSSRTWAKNLLLKMSLCSAVFLLFAFVTHIYNHDLSLFFLTFVYFLSGTPALIKTIEDLSELTLNIDVLMTLAAFLSVAIGSGLEGGLLLVLFALSEAMADVVTHKTKSAINSLHKLSPTMALVYDENSKTTFPKSVREIALDTILLIQAGQVVPLDGLVIDGSSFVDLKLLTGESIPVSKEVGSEVQAGALNLDGTLKIRVTKTSSDSTLARIIQLITEAQSAKPKLEKFLSRFSGRYASTIILLSLSFGIFLPLLFPHIPYLGRDGSIYRALA